MTTIDQIKEAAIEAACKMRYSKRITVHSWETASELVRSSFKREIKEIIDAYEAEMWKPIEEAPKDGTRVLVYASGVPGLPAIYCSAQYHSDAGWTVCDLRDVTHFRFLHQPPEVK